MKSIRVRAALLFSVAAMAGFWVLFAIGHGHLEGRLVANLDALIQHASQQIVARVALDAADLDEAALRRRIREAGEHPADLLYVTIVAHDPVRAVRFRSGRLLGQDIPITDTGTPFTVALPRIGAVRAYAVTAGSFEVVVGTPLAPVERTMASYERVGVGLAAAVLLCGGLIGLALSHLTLAPVRAIGATASRIGSADLAARIPVGTADDELSALARLLNRTFDRLEVAFDQIHRFSCEASHELKTPLTLIRLHAERMLRDPAFPAGHAEAVIVQIEEIARLDRIVDELLFLSRAEAGAVVLQARPQDPAPLLHALSRDVGILSEARGCRYRLSHEGRGRAVIEESFIRQVLLNLLTNALAASPPRSTVTVVSRISDAGWKVCVEDEGPGLEPALRARMFDRFVRFGLPEASDRGSGLGLAISRKLVELHGGRIYASGRDHGSGLRVVFELPAVPA